MKHIFLLLILGSCTSLLCAQGQTQSNAQGKTTAPVFPKPGEWPSLRRTGSLEAHSPLKGNITKPDIVWKQFVGAIESLLVVEPGDKDTKLNLAGEEVKLAAADSIRLPDFIPTPGIEEDNTMSQVWATYVDILPEYPGKEKIEFESAFAKPMTNGQWAYCVGRCYGKQNGEWKQIWETQPMSYLFNALPLAGDFDGDGTPEIAILPFYKMVLLDARTGQAKDSCTFNDNRSYGFHGVYDFDHDGKSEFLIEADFSKHVDVLGFRNGKLSLLWQHNIEPDIADPKRIMRVAPDPALDIDGDGQAEVFTTLYNDLADGQWHLTFMDALTGQTKVDFPDEYFAASLDLDGDGVKELLTTPTSGVGLLAKVRVRSLKGKVPKIIYEKDNATWQTWNPPMPRHVKSMATLGQQTVLSQVNNKGAYAVLRESASGNQPALSLVHWEGSTFKPISTITGENLEALGFDTSGRLLVRSRHQFGKPSPLVVVKGNVVKQNTKRVGFEASPALVAWPDAAKEPTIVVQGSVEEQVAFQPPTTAGAKVSLKHIPGRAQGASWPRSFGAEIVDLAGDGRRQLVVADVGASGLARISVKDLDGRVVWQTEFPRIAGSPAPNNTGGVLLWQEGHFTDHRRQDLLVTTMRSKMHSEETYLLSSQDGHIVWHRDRQISKRAVGGNSFAVADYDGDGLDDLASLWPSILYTMKGNTGKDILAMDAKWKQVYAKQVYFGHAVTGDFLNEGKPALYFSGQLMTGVIKLDGTLVWFDALDKSPAHLPSFGDFDGDGRADAVGVGYEDGVRCYDLASGKVKWQMPNPGGDFESFKIHNDAVKGTASADLDGDGRDEALVVIDRTLYCLGAPHEGSAGELRWKVEFPTVIGPPSVVALDREGHTSILEVGSDGYVYCLR